MAETQEAWAVVEADNSILIDTVSATEQVALMNWLSIHGDIAITNGWTLTALRGAFQESHLRFGGRVTKVYVSLEPADG